MACCGKPPTLATPFLAPGRAMTSPSGSRARQRLAIRAQWRGFRQSTHPGTIIACTTTDVARVFRQSTDEVRP